MSPLRFVIGLIVLVKCECVPSVTLPAPSSRVLFLLFSVFLFLEQTVATCEVSIDGTRRRHCSCAIYLYFYKNPEKVRASLRPLIGS